MATATARCTVVVPLRVSAPARIHNNQTLVVRVRTAPFARVIVSLFTNPRHPHLYEQVRGTAGPRGLFVARFTVRVRGFLPARLYLTVRVSQGCGHTTRTRSLRVLPAALLCPLHVALTVQAPGTIRSGGVLTVRVHTDRSALVSVTLRLGAHPSRVLGQAQGRAGRRGAFVALLHVTYRPSGQTAQAVLTVTVRRGCGVATHRVAVVIRR